MLRRFIPKGKSIADYTDDQIFFFADCINGLPRKILGHRTTSELFDAQLDAIYVTRHAVRHLPIPFMATTFTSFVGGDWMFYYYCYYFENYCNLLLQFAFIFQNCNYLSAHKTRLFHTAMIH